MALLKFKRSAVPAKVPALNDLALGELAINTYDGKVYTKKDNGTASIVEVGGGSGVTSFNTRTGAVTLSGSDVTTALGYTPANKAGDTFTGGVYSAGQIRAAGWWGDVSASATGLGVEIGESGGRSYVISYSRDVAAYGPMSFEATDFTFTGVSGGFIGANTSVRAPIFYDSNNTGYFLDPAGSSNLLSVQINGTLDVRDSNAQFWRSTNGAYQRVDTRTDATSFSRAHWYGVSSSGGTSNFRHAWYDNAAYFYVTAQDGEIIFNREAGETIVRSTGSFRAPIFYDSNDTAFFLDPNSTSVLSKVRANAIQHVNGTDAIALTDGSYLYFRSPDNGIRLYLGGADPANYYDNDAHNFRNRSGGKYAEISASGMYASTFYDYQNTAYYVDPASGSQLNIVSLNAGSKLHLVSLTDGNHYLRYAATGFSGAVIDGAQLAGHQGGELATNLGGDNWSLRWDASGNTFSRASSRAPIFYDSNNTAYYLDPASTGISGMINGEMRFGGGGNSSVITNDGDFYSRRKSSTSTGVYYFADGGQKYHYWDGTRYYYGNAGPTDTDVSFRAPIFYDSNNTGYYIDGNSTSNIYRLASYTAAQYNSGDWNAAFQNTPTQSYAWHGDVSSGGPSGSWWFYESMRHSNAANYWGTQIAWGWEDNSLRLMQRNVSNGGYSAWAEYLNTSGRTYNGNLNMTGSIISTASDVRAPIFYDQNDTSTFINPNGESWIKGDFKLSRVAAGGDNDCFGGLELREVSLVGAAQSAATYAPRLNFHWGSRAAATIYMDAGGSFVFGGQGNITSNRRSIFCNELYATGNVTAYYSDDRLKTRIGNIENALDIVSSLNGFRYVDNDLAKTFGYANENGQIGVSAQEVQKHLPEIVRPAAFDVDHDNPDHGSKTGENYLTVDYSRLVPLLIEAIKELRGEVEALKNRS